MSIALTGGSGKLGRLIVDHVARLGRPFITISRSDGTPWSTAEHRVVPRGYDDRDGMTRAFTGAATAFIMSTPDLPDVRTARHRTAIDAAAAAGVDRIVFLSLQNAVPGSPFPFAAANHDAELRVQQAGPAWTILAPNIYAEAIAAQQAPTIAARSILDWPMGRGAAAFITRDDIARTVAAVAADNRHANQRYELTGPATHDGDQIAGLLSDLLDRPIAYAPLAVDQYVAGLEAAGLPTRTAAAFAGLNAAIADDRFHIVTNDVASITGTPPVLLRDHLRTTLDAFG